MAASKRPTRLYASDLPDVAAGLRDAGRRLLARRGLTGVTINSVAEEAGEYRTSIAYYFGGKRGLLAAIADETCPAEACFDALAACERHQPGPQRVAAQMAALRAMAEDEEAFRALFELIPYMLREDDLRENLATLYEWYRELDEQMLGVTARDPEDLKYAAAFVCAAVDGLALQALIDPETIDLGRAFAVLGRAVAAFLRDLEQVDAS